MPQKELKNLRKNIEFIDSQILSLVKSRLKIARKIGKAKAQQELPTRDFSREKKCIKKAQKVANELGISAQFSQSLSQLLISESLMVQEKDRILANKVSSTKRVLIIGGSGQMGKWFAHFLSSQNIHVCIVDKHTCESDFEHFESLDELNDFSHDFIVVATPLHISANILQQLNTKKPSGIIFDIASVKQPLQKSIEVLAANKISVTSIHPMFGPNTKLLSGRHIILIDAGCKKANKEVKKLFSSTMATISCMSAGEHDKAISYLLGLSHAINILFFTVLQQSGKDAPLLKELSSTTFDAQLEVATNVALESPKLYYEIQSQNPFSDEPLAVLQQKVKQFRQIISSGQPEQFTQLMNDGAHYFENLK